jgi:hypothetical protein
METAATEEWRKITKAAADNKNKVTFIAIVLDNFIYSYPSVRNEIPGGNSEISGNFSIEEAKDLATVLNSGNLEARVNIVQSEVVGPTLGKESINAGLMSFALAFLLVLLYMFLYYGRAGWVADTAIGLGAGPRLPAFTYSSLVNAFLKDDPGLLKSTYGYAILSADWDSLWEEGTGSIEFAMDCHQEWIDGRMCTVIEGKGDLFKPRMAMFKEWLDEGLIWVRDESTDHIRIVIGRSNNIRKISEDDIFEMGKRVTIFQRGYRILFYDNDEKIVKKIGIKYWIAKCMAKYKEYVKSNTFFVQENAICGVDTLHIAGVHNRENACAALSAVKTVTPDVTNQQIAEGLAAFDGLPHRLKFVAEVDGVRYYDDSIATTPGSVIAAVRSFDAPKVLLMGGHDKGGDYDELLNVCKGANVKIVAYGANRDTLKQLFDAAGVPCVVVLGDMRAVVTAARAHVAPDSVVILSPAAASFDMFRSYAERGDQFIAAVKELR